jgi:hypothetical protein
MEIISLIHLKKRKIVLEDVSVSITQLKDMLEKDSALYVLDLDGIERNKPNLCLYQKLSQDYQLWIDAGPRELGDVVDAIMAGATNLTVRYEMWPHLNISNIKDISECGLYIYVDCNKKNTQELDLSLLDNGDGLVSYLTNNQIERDFNYGSFLKNIGAKYNVYIYDANGKNISYWKKIGIAGLFIDISKKGVATK